VKDKKIKRLPVAENAFEISQGVFRKDGYGDWIGLSTAAIPSFMN
jgi:hypothetical protein